MVYENKKVSVVQNEAVCDGGQAMERDGGIVVLMTLWLAMVVVVAGGGATFLGLIRLSLFRFYDLWD